MFCNYGFLPKIIQPTCVTEHNSSVIDNIFSNNIIADTKSGNILLTLSEHFVRRERLDYRRFQHDYSKFHIEEFRDDVSIQNWNTNLNNAKYLFLGCVDRQAPIKQGTPFFLMQFCPGTMAIHAESINSDLQRGLDSRLRHTTLNTNRTS